MWTRIGSGGQFNLMGPMKCEKCTFLLAVPQVHCGGVGIHLYDVWFNLFNDKITLWCCLAGNSQHHFHVILLLHFRRIHAFDQKAQIQLN